MDKPFLQKNATTFAFDVDAPLNWSYTLSDDIITLNPDESAIVLLTVTSPDNISLKDNMIQFEAVSPDNGITASLELIASSSPELVVADMSVICEGEEITLETLVSNTGLIDAGNVNVQFFNGPPSAHELLGEQTITVPPGETIAASIHCSIPDGIYTFYVVVDPDNSILESCESNNTLSIQYLLDRTPPEAEMFFDLSIRDITVKGIDNLDSSVEIFLTERVIKNKNIRLYILTDDAGNTTELQLDIHQSKHQIKAEIVGIKYNGQSTALLKNSFKIEYVAKNGDVIMLNQHLTIGNTEVHLVYNGSKNQTRISNGAQEIQEGICLLVFRTNRGYLQYRIENMR